MLLLRYNSPSLQRTYWCHDGTIELLDNEQDIERLKSQGLNFPVYYHLIEYHEIVVYLSESYFQTVYRQRPETTDNAIVSKYKASSLHDLNTVHRLYLDIEAGFSFVPQSDSDWVQLERQMGN